MNMNNEEFPYRCKDVTVKRSDGSTFTFFNQTRELAWPYTEEQVVKVEETKTVIKDN